jgi:hypothetical protein
MSVFYFVIYPDIALFLDVRWPILPASIFRFRHQFEAIYCLVLSD